MYQKPLICPLSQNHFQSHYFPPPLAPVASFRGGALSIEAPPSPSSSPSSPNDDPTGSPSRITLLSDDAYDALSVLVVVVFFVLVVVVWVGKEGADGGE